MGAQPKPRVIATVLAVALFALFCAPGADAADWRQIPAPEGKILSIAVANATTWLVEGPYVCCTRSYELTEDGGATWSQVQIPGFAETTIAGAADDGSFRIVGRQNFGNSNQEIQVFRVDAAGAKPLGPVIDGNTKMFQSFDISGDGRTWVPYWSPAQSAFELTVVGGDGSTATTALPAGSSTYGWAARRTVFGMRLIRFASFANIINAETRPTYRLDGAEVLPAEAHPVSLAEGELMLSSDGHASWDGGAHWSMAFDRTVPRTSQTEMPATSPSAAVSSPNATLTHFSGGPA